MKKLMISALVALAASNALAQETVTTVIRRSPAPKQHSWLRLVPVIGMGAGNFENYQQDYANTSVSQKMVFSGGMLVELGRGRFSFQSGLLYSQDGLDATVTRQLFNTTVTSTIQGRLDQIGLPLLGKANFKVSPSIKLNVKGGVVPTYLVGVTKEISTSTVYTGSAQSQAQTQSQTLSNKDGIREFNTYAQVGVGAEFGLGSWSDIRVEALYSRSLMTVFDGNRYDTLSAQSDVYASAFLGTIGFGFDL